MISQQTTFTVTFAQLAGLCDSMRTIAAEYMDPEYGGVVDLDVEMGMVLGEFVYGLIAGAL